MILDMLPGGRIGASLRSLRESAAMSVHELAAATSIDVEQLRAIERGRIVPSTAYIARATAVIGRRLRDPEASGW